MIRRGAFAVAIAAAAMAVLPGSALAHGDHDARPLVRQVPAGPYTVSLWQVYADSATAMKPHLIVMFDGLGAVPPGVAVRVEVNGRSLAVGRSSTTANGVETAEGLDTGDVVAVSVVDTSGSWELDPLVVPPPATSLLPIEELLYGSIFLTIGVAWWVVRRTARAWRRPAPDVSGNVPAN